MEKTNLAGRILYKNNQLIAVNKPSGIAVQPDKVGDKSLKDLVEIYCKHPVHLINRIDRPASGAVLFAKNKKAAALMTEQYKKQEVEKIYLAIVKNPPPEKKETKLINFLKKNERSNTSQIVESDTKGAKEAVLTYKNLANSDLYHLLEIRILTGRHHQIRTQLAGLGSPIKGDVKYGFRRGNRDRSIHLHAWKLAFSHPVSKEQVKLIAPIPEIDPLWAFFNEKV